MLLYPSGQMSDCFTNVNVICITQTFEFIKLHWPRKEKKNVNEVMKYCVIVKYVYS